jgi:hypothetical protein
MKATAVIPAEAGHVPAKAGTGIQGFRLQGALRARLDPRLRGDDGAAQ